MSRDMKPRKSQPAKSKSRGGTLIGMFVGLVIGVGLAAGVVWYMNKAPVPFINKGTQGTKAEPTAPQVPPAANGKPAVSGTAAQPQVLALPGKPGDPVPEKRFQFYDILPGKAEAVPDKAPKDGKTPATADAKKDEKKDEGKDAKQAPVFLQAGSFTNAGDADNQKAKLALMGEEATVQQVMVQDKTFYRVRLGPYAKSEDALRARAELAKSGIDAQIAK